MSDLTRHRDWLRRMSTAAHAEDCPSLAPAPPRYVLDGGGQGWVLSGRTFRPTCAGCVSDADRALFARLADELDAHMSRDQDIDLFGDVTALPADETEETA